MPRMDASEIVSTCYLGADKTKGIFVSDRGYRIPACPQCVYSCLGYEMGAPDDKGCALIKIDHFDEAYGEFTSESGKTLKFLRI